MKSIKFLLLLSMIVSCKSQQAELHDIVFGEDDGSLDTEVTLEPTSPSIKLETKYDRKANNVKKSALNTRDNESLAREDSLINRSNLLEKTSTQEGLQEKEGHHQDSKRILVKIHSLINEDKIEEAEDLIHKNLEGAQDSNPELYFLKSSILVLKNQPDAALAFLRVGLGQDSNNEEARLLYKTLTKRSYLSPRQALKEYDRKALNRNLSDEKSTIKNTSSERKSQPREISQDLTEPLIEADVQASVAKNPSLDPAESPLEEETLAEQDLDTSEDNLDIDTNPFSKIKPVKDVLQNALSMKPDFRNSVKTHDSSPKKADAKKVATTTNAKKVKIITKKTAQDVDLSKLRTIAIHKKDKKQKLVLKKTMDQRNYDPLFAHENTPKPEKKIKANKRKDIRSTFRNGIKKIAIQNLKKRVLPQDDLIMIDEMELE